MKTFKTYTGARIASNGEPIISIHTGGKMVYITGIAAHSEICLLDSVQGHATAYISANKLDRLGDANYSTRNVQLEASRPRAFKTGVAS